MYSEVGRCTAVGFWHLVNHVGVSGSGTRPPGNVRLAGNPRQRLLNAFHFRYWRIELTLDRALKTKLAGSHRESGGPTTAAPDGTGTNATRDRSKTYPPALAPGPSPAIFHHRSGSPAE